MGFYGTFSNPAQLGFDFDRIYPNVKMAKDSAPYDNVYNGRYVLVSYQNELDALSPFYIDKPLYKYGENSFGYNSQGDFTPKEGVIYYVAPIGKKDEEKNSLKYNYEVYFGSECIKSSEQNFSEYSVNRNIDKKVYNKYYDCTVWKKCLVNGEPSYIQVADFAVDNLDEDNLIPESLTVINPEGKVSSASIETIKTDGLINFSLDFSNGNKFNIDASGLAQKINDLESGISGLTKWNENMTF